ncbi:DUF3775 domain-containing protein [Microvirga tunisiensis]|uniref:DUF3775 domain-containing protein n=1 Tax=Pannonibacter tanglangensis TaxID=2750084 RepID=A0A7X5EZM7_9HYPH|nr:DUF3775 domain-containing protein [Pannonibacter sp. XCT-53]NBN77062.1 DUF3775 domain-containing protein [Pannonibacter sp. XCT-53]
MVVDLSLSPDTIRMFAQKARSASTALDDAYEDRGETNIELDPDRLAGSHHHDALAEEESEDLSEEELRELLDDLNVDEASELVAIVWIGRGDYEAGDFLQAVEEARDRAFTATSGYLLRMPMLADHLENGLETLGL